MESNLAAIIDKHSIYSYFQIASAAHMLHVPDTKTPRLPLSNAQLVERSQALWR